AAVAHQYRDDRRRRDERGAEIDGEGLRRLAGRLALENLAVVRAQLTGLALGEDPVPAGKCRHRRRRGRCAVVRRECRGHCRRVGGCRGGREEWTAGRYVVLAIGGAGEAVSGAPDVGARRPVRRVIEIEAVALFDADVHDGVAAARRHTGGGAIVRVVAVAVIALLARLEAAIAAAGQRRRSDVVAAGKLQAAVAAAASAAAPGEHPYGHTHRDQEDDVAKPTHPLLQ